jgi:choline-sulfatase
MLHQLPDMHAGADLVPDRHVSAHSIKKAGYHTCHIGKSHLHPHGGDKDLRDEEPYMRALGWDDVRETTGPFSTRTTKSILTDFFEANGIYDLFIEDYRKRSKVGVDLAHWPSPLPEGKHADDFIGQQAVDYIKSSDKSKPLYQFVGIGGPHNPWDPPQRFDTYPSADMPDALPRDPAPEWLTGPAREYHEKVMSFHPNTTPEQFARLRALYSAKVEHVDAVMGRVLEAWYATRGRDSWVLFWTDHGEMAGDKGRCSKSVFFESSAHVPAILRPPGGAPNAVTCDGLISLPDLTATVLDAAGCEPQQNVFGRSIRPALDGSKVGSSVVVSEIDDRAMIFDGRWKMVVNAGNDVLQLFDLKTDPTESLNLAGKSDTKGEADRLKHELLSFRLRTDDRQFREVNG